MPLRQLAAVWSSFQLAMAEPRSHFGGARARVEPAAVAAGRAGAAPAPGAGIRARAVQLSRRQRGPAGRHVRARARQDLRARRADRRRQDHDRVADGAALRSDGRTRARSTDATSGRCPPAERAARIGFILQEPFLFTGTDPRQHRLRQRRAAAADATSSSRRCWPHGTSTACWRGSTQGWRPRSRPAATASAWGRSSSSPSCAPCCASPEILILDEATANIDTVTEQLLEQILRELPASTTKVIIAHRLNTIENADEIFFVNAGEIVARRLDAGRAGPAAARQTRELAAAAQAACRVSFSTWPSRMWMTRWACAAMSASWVTRMMVLPAWCSLREHAP